MAKQLSLSSMTALISGGFSPFQIPLQSGTGRSLNVEIVRCGKHKDGLFSTRRTLIVAERLNEKAMVTNTSKLNQE